MTGQDIIDWIKENDAEEEEIYIESGGRLYKPVSGFDVFGSEDCPCYGMIVIR